MGETFLAEAQQLSRTGSFGWNLSNGEIFWSEETYRIFGYEPSTRVTFDALLQRVHPEANEPRGAVFLFTLPAQNQIPNR